jgi:hypothetical protein
MAGGGGKERGKARDKGWLGNVFLHKKVSCYIYQKISNLKIFYFYTILYNKL